MKKVLFIMMLGLMFGQTDRIIYIDYSLDKVMKIEGKFLGQKFEDINFKSNGNILSINCNDVLKVLQNDTIVKFECKNSNDSKYAVSKNNDSYDIVKKEDISYQNFNRFTFRVLINNSNPKKEEIQIIADEIYKKHFEDSWNELTIFIYLPKMNTNSIAYAISEYNDNGIQKFEINEWAKDFITD